MILPIADPSTRLLRNERRSAVGSAREVSANTRRERARRRRTIPARRQSVEKMVVSSEDPLDGERITHQCSSALGLEARFLGLDTQQPSYAPPLALKVSSQSNLTSSIASTAPSPVPSVHVTPR